MTATPPELPTETDVPAAFKVFGILKIAFGAIGVLMGFQSMLVAPDTQVILDEVPAWAALVSPGLQAPGMVVSAIFVVVGIGLLKVRRWSPPAAIWVSILSLVWGIGSSIYIYPVMMEALGQAQSGIGKTTVISGLAAAAFSILGGIAYTIFVLAYMNSVKVKNYLRRDSLDG